MHTLVRVFISLVALCCLQQIQGQEDYQAKIRDLKAQRERIVTQEKEALKEAVMRIDRQLREGEINAETARELKESAARKHALNIENRQAIIDNKIALLERNQGMPPELQDSVPGTTRILVGWGDPDVDGSRIFGIRYDDWRRDKPIKYDRRTYSDLVVALGFNNALIEGQSLGDSPYRFAGSRFFEIGWAWRTRVFKNTNFLRFHYGFSFQFNGLKPEKNQYFVNEGGQTVLQEFEFDLDKSKFRMDNLVIPVHFEFGPSRVRKSENRIRYSLNNQFRIGLGAYGGLNLGSRQKLKYDRDGERVKDKLKRGYNTSDLIYGLSAYMGVEGVLLYVKYDLNPIFKDAAVEQRNLSLGLRFDL